MKDLSDDLQQQIETAAAENKSLTIQGGGSKSFLGIKNNAIPLELRKHSGIISYEPTELVITARAGTTLKEINATLAAEGQALAFEPPSFGESATIGGTIACAMAGPAKPYLGGARDHILGCRVLNGRAQNMKFGGEVMKNVAGYDVSRLMTGAMGTLGVLLDVSVKVMPHAEQAITVATEMNLETAINKMQALAGLGLPVTASAYIDGTLYTRLSGTEVVTSAAAKQLGFNIEATATSSELWNQLSEHTLPFFTQRHDRPLWRLSVPPLTPPIDLPGDDNQWIYDWAGMQRWLISSAPASVIRSACQSVNGHATLYRASIELQRESGVFHPLPAPLLKLHKRLKQEFDPAGIFNHQRLFPEY